MKYVAYIPTDEDFKKPVNKQAIFKLEHADLQRAIALVKIHFHKDHNVDGKIPAFMMYEYTAIKKRKTWKCVCRYRPTKQNDARIKRVDKKRKDDLAKMVNDSLQGLKIKGSDLKDA
ncbi:MAG: hypothetical protein COA82_03365 [Alkaliphilus sp.]|nr:MAG: hypothetical protein COA82_03365 [Alkaliphilus sp.]